MGWGLDPADPGALWTFTPLYRHRCLAATGASSSGGFRVLAKPSPIELTTPINPERGLEGQRNLFCVHYDDCLDEAVKQGWNSFCCSACGLASAEPDEAAGIDGYATQRRFV
jgi:hypothetical protein